MLVRKSTAKRIKKHLKEIPYLYRHGFITAEQALSKIASAHGWLKHANTYNFRESIHFKELEKEVRGYE